MPPTLNNASCTPRHPARPTPENHANAAWSALQMTASHTSRGGQAAVRMGGRSCCGIALHAQFPASCLGVVKRWSKIARNNARFVTARQPGA
eukprot:355607-Chlamydomonas_euryale.AAC.2